MRLIRSLAEYRPLSRGGTWAAIGKWDGVHLGHRSLISHMVRKAREAGGEALVIGFHPHPAAVLGKGSPPAYLQTIAERLEAMKALGVDTHLVLPFTPEFAQWAPEAFVERVLVQGIGARHITVGFNFSFGWNRTGTSDSLRQLCAGHGVDVDVIPAVTVGGEPVSSTAIRRYLAAGQLDRACRMWGRPAAMCGVAERFQEATPLPLLRLMLGSRRQLPPVGAYDVKVRLLSSGAALPLPEGAEPQPGRLIVASETEANRCLLLMPSLDAGIAGCHVHLELLRVSGGEPV